MPARVRQEIRRRSDPAAFQGKLGETVILRDNEVVAVLPEGDPLRYALQFPIDELWSMRDNLTSVLERQPRTKKVLEAFIQHKEEQPGSDNTAAQAGSRKCVQREVDHRHAQPLLQ
ncbi:MAG: hypothetical protein MUP14_06370 [Dehalococcoidia bacterium]|nr:hypothetical protein [Dehalococcoidia bacterium]